MRALSKRTVAVALIAVVVVAAATFLYARGRNAANRAACIHRLRQIDGAKKVWALEHFAKHDSNGDRWMADGATRSNTVPTWKDIYEFGGRCSNYCWGDYYPPRCPTAGTYTIGKVADAPTCTIPGHTLE